MPGKCRGGRKVLLSLGLGNQESYEDWLEFLRDMVKRGLPVPTLITSGGAPGLIKAVETVPLSIRGRCGFHQMNNFFSKVPKEVWPEIKLEPISIRDAKDYKTGLKLAQEFQERYQDNYPSLVKTLNDDLETLLAHLKLPALTKKEEGLKLFPVFSPKNQL